MYKNDLQFASFLPPFCSKLFRETTYCINRCNFHGGGKIINTDVSAARECISGAALL